MFQIKTMHLFRVKRSITPNGLRIGDGGAFEKRLTPSLQKSNRITNVEFTTVSPTIANTMLAARCSSLHLF